MLTQASVSKAEQTTIRSIDDSVNHIRESARADFALKTERKEMTRAHFIVMPVISIN